MAELYETEQSDIRIYCNGEADTIQQGQTGVQFPPGGYIEITKVTCK